MTYRFLEIASLELQDTLAYYDKVDKALGDRFLEAVSSALDRIARNPKANAEIASGMRKCIIHRFRHQIIYKPLEAEILILAISHTSRKPDHWKARAAGVLV